MADIKKNLENVLDELEQKKEMYKKSFRLCFADKKEYNSLLVGVIPTILGENSDDDFEKTVIGTLDDLLEMIKEKYGKDHKECLKMLLYACLDGMIKIGDLLGVFEDISNSKQLEAFREYMERREIIKEKLVENETMYIDKRGIINLEDIDKLNEIILIVEDLTAADDIIEYCKSKWVFLEVTERGFRTYLLKVSSQLNEQTGKVLGETVKAEGEIKEIKDATDELFKDTKNTQTRIEKIEGNFITYMSVFIAIFSLIGINYSYTAKIIQRGDINGVILLNGSVVVALTTIFMLLNLIKLDAMRCEENSYKHAIRTRGLEFLFIIGVEVIATCVLYSLL